MVYVLSASGNPLMPTERHGRVRHLLDRREARVVRRTPFTIQLTYETEERTQPITLGIDAGSKTVGISAATKSKEVFAAELTPRNDVVKLLSKRRELRRARRSRTTRHREPRFDNRTHSKHKGWLAPSVEVKIHNHIQGIRLATRVLPIAGIVIETGEFDLQRLKAMEEGRPLPVGTDYQLGEMYDEYNVRQYVLHRDGYCCRKCRAKGDGIKLHVHHLESRQTGGNRPANLITLCETCHKKYHEGKISLDGAKPGRNYRDAAFMGIMRPTLMARVRAEFPNVPIKETKGYITKFVRELNGIVKSHINDARCIGGNPYAKSSGEVYRLKPVRAHNRKLHKETILKGGYRKANQAPKKMFGYRLFDKVLCNGEEGFIFGRRSSGSFDIRTLDGNRLSAGISYKKLSLKENATNVLIERRKAIPPPPVEVGVSSPIF